METTWPGEGGRWPSAWCRCAACSATSRWTRATWGRSWRGCSSPSGTRTGRCATSRTPPWRPASTSTPPTSTSQVLPRPVGLAGQLRPGLAHRGGAGRSAWPLPCGCPYCTDPHRPGRLLRLQICGHDCRPLGRASVWEAWLLHAAQLVLCHHLCLYDPFAAPEDPVRGNQRGPEAGHPEPSTHVPDHGCGWAAAPPHVLADLSPHLLMLCSGSCFVPPTSTHHFQPAPSPRPPWLHRRQSRANGHFRALIHSTLVLLWVGGAWQFTLLPP